MYTTQCSRTVVWSVQVKDLQGGEARCAWQAAWRIIENVADGPAAARCVRGRAAGKLGSQQAELTRMEAAQFQLVFMLSIEQILQLSVQAQVEAETHFRAQAQAKARALARAAQAHATQAQAQHD